MLTWPKFMGAGNDGEIMQEDNVTAFPTLERDDTPTHPHRRQEAERPITRRELVEFFQEHAHLFQPPANVADDPLKPEIALEIRCAREIFAELQRFKDDDSRERVMKMVETFKELYGAVEHPQGAPV